MRAIKFLIWTSAWIVVLVCAAWATGAIYFDFPVFQTSAAIAFLFLLFATIIFLRGKALKLTTVLAASSRSFAGG